MASFKRWDPISGNAPAWDYLSILLIDSLCLYNQCFEMTPEDAAEALKLDESRFTGDGGDLILLNSLRKAEQAIEVASPVSMI